MECSNSANAFLVINIAVCHFAVKCSMARLISAGLKLIGTEYAMIHKVGGNVFVHMTYHKLRTEIISRSKVKVARSCGCLCLCEMWMEGSRKFKSSLQHT